MGRGLNYRTSKKFAVVGSTLQFFFFRTLRSKCAASSSAWTLSIDTVLPTTARVRRAAVRVDEAADLLVQLGVRTPDFAPRPFRISASSRFSLLGVLPGPPRAARRSCPVRLFL